MVGSVVSDISPLAEQQGKARVTCRPGSNSHSPSRYSNPLHRCVEAVVVDDVDVDVDVDVDGDAFLRCLAALALPIMHSWMSSRTHMTTVAGKKRISVAFLSFIT